jgi:hypothetical protein
MQIASFTALGFRGTIDVAISAIDVSEIILSAMFFVITSLFKYNHIWIILDNFNKIDSGERNADSSEVSPNVFNSFLADIIRS